MSDQLSHSPEPEDRVVELARKFREDVTVAPSLAQITRFKNKMRFEAGGFVNEGTVIVPNGPATRNYCARKKFNIQRNKRPSTTARTASRYHSGRTSSIDLALYNTGEYGSRHGQTFFDEQVSLYNLLVNTLDKGREYYKVGMGQQKRVAHREELKSIVKSYFAESHHMLQQRQYTGNPNIKDLHKT